MIGIRSAFSIRARGHRPHLEAVYMTAPRSVCRNTKKALPTGGRPYMTAEANDCFRPHRSEGRREGKVSSPVTARRNDWNSIRVLHQGPRPPAESRGRIHYRSPIRLPKHQKSLADRGPSIHDVLLTPEPRHG